MSYSKYIEPKVSIVVTVYNAEKYICRCIDSILNQTYKNFEVILVDDGSSDNSLEILKGYALKDIRLKVISQKNSGPSSARNKGILAARGEYLTFIDIDDYIHKDYLSVLYNEIKKGLDLVFIGYTDISRYGVVDLNDFYNENIELNKKRVIENIFKGVGGTLWSKIFRRDIILKNEILLNREIHMYEDQLFVLQYVLIAERFSALNSNGYNYNRLNENSLSSKLSIKYYPSLIKYIDELEKILDKYSSDKALNQSVFNKKLESIYYSLMLKIYSDKSCSSKERLESIRFLSKDKKLETLDKLESDLVKKLKDRSIYRLHIELQFLINERKIKDFIKFKVLRRGNEGIFRYLFSTKFWR